jgi:hypothetical protein
MSPDARDRGLTLVELTFALVSLAFVGLAIASLMAATSNAWESRDDQRAQSESIRTTSRLLSDLVRHARRVVATHDDGQRVDLVLWTDDVTFAGQVNLAEIRLLTFDRSAGSLVLHAADLTFAERQSEGVNPAFAPTVVADASFPAAFRERHDTAGYPLAGNVARLDVALTRGDAPFSAAHITIVVDGSRDRGEQLALVSAVARAPDSAIDFGTGGE